MDWKKQKLVHIIFFSFYIPSSHCRSVGNVNVFFLFIKQITKQIIPTLPIPYGEEQWDTIDDQVKTMFADRHARFMPKKSINYQALAQDVYILKRFHKMASETEKKQNLKANFVIRWYIIAPFYYVEFLLCDLDSALGGYKITNCI